MRLLTRKPPERPSQRDPRHVLTPLQEAAMRMAWHYNAGGGDVNWNFMLAPDEETQEFMRKTPDELIDFLAEVLKNADLREQRTA